MLLKSNHSIKENLVVAWLFLPALGIDVRTQ
jgi:hypothetical protein